jgi:exodeoxyribonuclease V alpha subunit
LRGHVCLEVGKARDLVRQEADDDDARPVADAEWPEAGPWREALARCAARPGAIVRPAGPGDSPLVLEGDRLYLDRYWDYEQRLSREILARAGTRPPGVADADLRTLVDGLFPRGLPGADGLRSAATTVATHGFSIVAGGPGTGKTTTVTKILAMILELSRRAAGAGTWTPPRIALMAPTGKAAARMKESIRREVDDLAAQAGTGIDPSVLPCIPVEASTLHRRLGSTPDHPTRFRFGADNPLPVDVAVVDEASMTDFALMTRLVEAIPRDARLILLGDRDQLASVEAGAVLGDLCGDPDATTSGDANAPAIAGAVAFLTHPFRFGADTGIGALSRAIRARDTAKALAYLRRQAREPGAPAADGPYTDLVFVEPGPGEAQAGRPAAGRHGRANGPDVFDRVKGRVVAHLRPFLEAALAGDAATALARQRDFCILTPHRRGRLGVEGLNSRVEGWLAESDTHGITPREEWYVGRPILVMENDHGLELFNGDMGVIVRVDDQVRAAFPGRNEGEVRLLHPGRLPSHETVFAMTVHKSQGSQFAHVLIVLPERPSPILTRELLYTAVTRARTDVTVLGSPAVIEGAIRESVLRFSGLRQKVWKAVS